MVKGKLHHKNETNINTLVYHLNSPQAFKSMQRCCIFMCVCTYVTHPNSSTKIRIMLYTQYVVNSFFTNNYTQIKNSPKTLTFYFEITSDLTKRYKNNTNIPLNTSPRVPPCICYYRFFIVVNIQNIQFTVLSVQFSGINHHHHLSPELFHLPKLKFCTKTLFHQWRSNNLISSLLFDF